VALTEVVDAVREWSQRPVPSLWSQTASPLGGSASSLAIALLQVAGPAMIGLALAKAAADADGPRRTRLGLPIVLLALGLVTSLVWAGINIASLLAPADPDMLDLVAPREPLDFARAAVAPVSVLAWATVAAAAVVAHASGAVGRSILVGALLVFFGALLPRTMFLAAAAAPVGPEDGNWLMAFVDLASILRPAGLLLLTVGLATHDPDGTARDTPREGLEPVA
jgi:hypothetical protein